MKYVTLSLFFLGLCLETWSQETAGAPYNPDSNADSLISVPDILSVIPLFGQEFLPSEDDLDSTNEIQSLYISNDTLYLVPNGGFILLGDIAPQINLDSLVSSLSVDSTFIANVGGSMGVPEIFSIECVEMGYFDECSPDAGICEEYEDLSPNSSGGYVLYNECPSTFNPDLCHPPHWRKFVIHGVNLSSFESMSTYAYKNTYLGTGEPYVHRISQQIRTVTLYDVTETSVSFYVSSIPDWEAQIPGGFEHLYLDDGGPNSTIQYPDWSDLLLPIFLTSSTHGIREAPFRMRFFF